MLADAMPIRSALLAIATEAGELAQLVCLNAERLDLSGDLGARVLADLSRISRDLDTVATVLSSCCDPGALQVPARPARR